MEKQFSILVVRFTVVLLQKRILVIIILVRCLNGVIKNGNRDFIEKKIRAFYTTAMEIMAGFGILGKPA